MKNWFSRAMSLVAVLMLVAAMSSCKKSLASLSLTSSVTETEFTILGGEILEIDFKVNNTEGNPIKVAVSSDNKNYPATVEMDETVASQGTVKVAAPKYIYHEATINVTLTISDPATSRELVQPYVVNARLADNFVAVTEPANCFIVAPGSIVKFPANYGSTSDKVTFETASLVWQDAVGLVENIDVEPADNYVYAALKEGISGNAVIAVKNAEGSVVWSYNLWVADYNPDSRTMSYKASDELTYVFMDRYIGATSVVPGTDASHGNFYQWGRKDAFAGSTVSGTLKPMYDIEGKKITRTIEACAEENNIPNGIANPLTHYSGVNGGNYGWLTTVKATFASDMTDLWGGDSGKKTMYDPCPAGWMVPPVEAWGFYATATSGFVAEKVYVEGVESPANKDMLGRNWSPDGVEKFYFPAMGEVQHGGTFASGAGTSWPCNKVWTCSTDPANYRVWATNVSPSSASAKGGLGTGYELPVRCIKEN